MRGAYMDNKSSFSDLILILNILDGKSNEDWMTSIEARKIAEAKFHDASHSTDTSHEEEYSNSKFYAVAESSDAYYYTWVDTHVRNKVVLDFACGNGGGAIRAAMAGAKLAIGLDISRGSIENAKQKALKLQLNNTFFVQGDCEKTQLPDNSIDIVLCSGMLHHIDLTYAFPELRRIMKPGAILLANEALSYNPIIKLYRKLTPHLRTEFEAEHIISHDDLLFASKFFAVRNIRYWHLFSIMAVPFRNSSCFRSVLKFLQWIDFYALKIPLLRNMAWQFTFELVKQAEK